MRSITSRKRRRIRKHALAQPVSLIVEALEPRLVLSAAGFGFDGLHERPEFHARERGEFDSHRSVLADSHRDIRVSEGYDYGGDRYETSPRPVFGFNQDQREKRLDGGQADVRPADDFFAGNRREPRLEDRANRPSTYLGRPEGESTNSPFEPVGNSFGSEPFQEVLSPSFTVVLITLPPSGSSSLRGDIGRPSTTLASPPRSNFFVTSNQPISAAITLPVAGSITSSISSRVGASEFEGESPSIRFEVTPINNESASDVRASSQVGFSTFVSLSTNDLASYGNTDSESDAFGITVLDRLSGSNDWATNGEPARTLQSSQTNDRTARLSEESLWASVSEGGFIEIDATSDDDSHEQTALADESDEAWLSRRDSNRTSRDAFWFDFSDSRLDLLLDKTDLEALAEHQNEHNAPKADEQAWLLDEGGMIVLTKAQISDAAIDSNVEGMRQLAAVEEADSGEIDIPMDAGIGVFQAIDVATTLVEQQGDSPLAVDRSVASEAAATADAEEVSAPVEQAVRSDAGQPEPVRSAAMPLLVAIATFFARGRQNRKKEEDGHFKV